MRFKLLILFMCLLAAAVIIWFLRASGSRPKPNILLMTLDTTRRDHLSCYGYGEKTTPAIDALAEESVRYDNAISPSSWTLPAHASIFTGMLPTHHSAHFAFEDNAAVGRVDEVSYYSLHPLLPVLPEELGKAGYVTAGFVGAPLLRTEFGFRRGFAYYDDEMGQSPDSTRPADEITSRVIEWLGARHDIADRTPFFCTRRNREQSE